MGQDRDKGIVWNDPRSVTKLWVQRNVPDELVDDPEIQEIVEKMYTAEDRNDMAEVMRLGNDDIRAILKKLGSKGEDHDASI